MFKIPGLVKGIVIKRPSAQVKTPYVADVKIVSTGQIVLAHTTALGCNGMIDAGEIVYIAPIVREKDADRHCTHRVYLARTKGAVVVGTDPHTAEVLVEIALRDNSLKSLQNVKSYKRQMKVREEGSRFDFAGVDKNGTPFVMEVKSVPLCADGVAYFPDGYRKKKTDPVSVRALKHIRELTDIQSKPGMRCIMCYVVQRSDAKRFKPADADPEYQAAFADAVKSGVEVIVMIIDWTSRGVATLVKTEHN